MKIVAWRRWYSFQKRFGLVEFWEYEDNNPEPLNIDNMIADGWEPLYASS